MRQQEKRPAAGKLFAVVGVVSSTDLQFSILRGRKVTSGAVLAENTAPQFPLEAFPEQRNMKASAVMGVARTLSILDGWWVE